MDAVGLASAILTFVDVSLKATAAAREAYQSNDGALRQNAKLQSITQDVRLVAGDLRSGCSAKSDSEKSVKQLAGACADDSQRLLQVLDKLKVPAQEKRVFRRIFKAVAAVRANSKAREEIDDLRYRIGEHRNNIMLNLPLLLQYVAPLDFESARTLLTRQPREYHNSVAESLGFIREDCKLLKADLVAQLDCVQSTLSGVTQAAIDRSNKANVLSQALLKEFAFAWKEWNYLATAIPIQHRILRQLVFPDMHLRHARIPSAGESTCGWILDYPQSEELYAFGYNMKARVPVSYRNDMKENFLEWLRSGQNVLHISGQPGAGKSVLMKYIAENSRTLENLRIWAGTKTLVTASSYFWNSGSELQMSLQGLYRCLLFEVLSRCPELIEDVFPRQWKLLKASSSTGDRMVENNQMFKEADIEKAFEALVSRGQYDRHRFCFFIDGLDEYEGNILAKEELANKIKGWTRCDDIKVCVSSRPYLVLEDAFRCPQTPTIHLHKLNNPSIMAYCYEKFEGDTAFMNAFKGERDSSVMADLLTEFINRNCEGIFLWAVLVVDIIRTAVRQGDPEHVVWKKVEELPPELNQLYSKLKDSVQKSPIDRVRAHQILLLAARDPRGMLPAMVLSWLDEGTGPVGYLGHEDFPAPAGIATYSLDEVESRLATVKRQIDALARGFLEYEGPRLREIRGTFDRNDYVTYISWNEVHFTHRTARDFLLGDEDRVKDMEQSCRDLLVRSPKTSMDVWGKYKTAMMVYCGALALPTNTNDLEKEFRKMVGLLATRGPLSCEDDLNFVGSMLKADSFVQHFWPPHRMFFGPMPHSTKTLEYHDAQLRNNSLLHFAPFEQPDLYLSVMSLCGFNREIPFSSVSAHQQAEELPGRLMSP
ncbi:hypothetical protein F4780DRAFT_797260 [Xylariomycetidae sp. FL0641]|nr:hypothetical protein F4780DRAFT_797260 [Xylariomycetidae sp. FL0641]